MEQNHEPCPLCGERGTKPFHRDSRREYLLCPGCDLVFVPRRYHISHEEERRRYELHENSHDDSRYRAFLRALADPVTDRLEPGACGLDFGSGPGPTMSVILREMGFEASDYDPFFADDRSLLEERYDFVTCTETAEHFSCPAREFELIFGLVRHGGIVGIMTQMRAGAEEFASWYYTREDSHISFYTGRSFEWIADRFGAGLTLIGKSVAIFEKA